MFWNIFSDLCEKNNYKPTSQKIADIIGVTTSAIRKWQNGDVIPNSDVLIRIADFFDVSIDYLLGRDFEPKTNYLDVQSEDVQILKMIKSLDVVQRSRIIVEIDSMVKA